MEEKNEDISKMIEHLKRIMDNVGQYTHSIQLLLSHVSKPLLVDDRGLMQAFNMMSKKVMEITESLSCLDLGQTLSEIKYVGNRLNVIEKCIAEIKEEGIEKKIRLDISCEGYELIKKKPESICQEQEFDPDKALNDLLDSLSDREKQCIIYRLGLFGEKKATYDKIGEIFRIGRERVSQIYKKSIRKLRHPSRMFLVEKITHIELKEQILGKED